MSQLKATAGRWALITGASSGIGYELSRLFAHEGVNVVLVSRNAGQLADVGRELENQYPIKSLVLPKDMSDPAAPEEIHAEVLKQGISIDILVNNAGFGDLEPFAVEAWEVQRQMLQVNVAGLVHLTRLFLPEMIKRRHGRILNISSTAAFSPVPYMAVYAAAKAFVLSFTQALSVELEGTGITATVLCPGVTATGFARRAKTEHTWLVRLNQMNAADVARIGYRALMKGRSRVVPGWFNKLLTGSIRFSHPALLLKVSKLLMRPSTT